VTVEDSLQTKIRLPGVGRTSPLARGLSVRLRDVRVNGDTDYPHAPSSWRRAVADTNLKWWDDAATAGGKTAASRPADTLVLDLHGHEAVSCPHVWRVVDAAGRPILSPFIALDYCRRAAGIVALFLIESRDGGVNWEVLSDVHLSASQSYRGLLRGIGAAVPSLIAAGFRSRSQPQEWRPAKRRSQRLARLGYPLRHAAARCEDWMTSEVWAVGVLDRDAGSLLAGGTVSPKFWLQVPERDGYIADPFPMPGQTNVFLCERYHHRTGRGSLQSVTTDGARIVATEDLRIDVDCHLSYPFPFEENGRVFCLPEMGASRRQVIYDLSTGLAPRPVCVVAENVAMADATLFRHADLYFIAYTDLDIGLHDNLCLLWADRLEGPWMPHPGNPVKIDVRSSRCAGNPFRVGDWLVRPAQDCARTYGAAIALNRVIECTRESYHEEPIGRLVPEPAGPFPAGLHTLSSHGQIILIDGKKVVLDPGVILRRIKRRLVRPRSVAPSGRAGLTIAARPAMPEAK
jgi:hypothetical protein